MAEQQTPDTEHINRAGATSDAANDAASENPSSYAAPEADRPEGVAEAAAFTADGGVVEDAPPTAGSGAEPAPGLSGDLAARVSAAEAKAKEYYDALLRARAEFENFKRRSHEDVVKARKFAIESFAEHLVPVADSLDAALADQSPAQLREGVDLTLRQLKSAFEKGKLVEIDPAGEKFDPHRHQAISAVPSTDMAPGHVVSVLQKGWMIADRVLRPALVTVSQAQ